MLLQGFYSIMGWVSLALLFFAVFAFVDAAVRRGEAYRAAGKRTKPFWLIVLGLSAVLLAWLPILSILPIAGLVGTIVYMVDVRPAVREITGGSGRRRGGSSSDGPYGPFSR
jgi:hypothetical protein